AEDQSAGEAAAGVQQETAPGGGRRAFDHRRSPSSFGESECDRYHGRAEGGSALWRAGAAAPDRMSEADSHFERREADPAPLAIRPVTGLGELHALGAFDEGRWEGRVLGHVFQEQFPAGAIAIA